MASANALPRIRKHDNDSANSLGADSSRYASARDHYVSPMKFVIPLTEIDCGLFRSPQGTTVVGTETETVEIEGGESAITSVAVIEDDQGHPMEDDEKRM